MNNFETVIGIEIHIELNTKTKMFSPAKNHFGQEPNTLVHPIDLGYPGTMPQVNKEAIIKAIKFAKALNMKINRFIKFDRKHYFYVDLPKGYQITQNNFPFGSEGNILVNVNGKDEIIKLERFHLEEDTAKSHHKANKTLLDFNRAGIPLIEVVTLPVINSAEMATAYVNAIRELAQTLNISDAKMEEGSLRADINISLKPKGQKELGTKVEIKNINTLKNIKKAIENEISDQKEKLLNGIKINQSTKRFDEATGKNITMRIKTEAADYRFFPEPNINIIEISEKFIENVKIPELPWERKARYQKDGINKEYIEKLLDNLNNADFFDQIKLDNRQELAKVFFAEIVSIANKKGILVKELNIDTKEIVIAINKVKSGEISGKHLKIIIPKLVNRKDNTLNIINTENMKQISDEKEINNIIKEIIHSNQKFINENKGRSGRIIKFILGNVMKISKGQANPIIANKLVKKMLGE